MARTSPSPDPSLRDSLLGTPGTPSYLATSPSIMHEQHVTPPDQQRFSGLFRSQEMRYVSITMTNESAHQTVRELGHFAKFHVIDLGGKEQPSRQHLAYKKRVADCGAWERKLNNFEDQMSNYNVRIPDVPPRELVPGDVLESLQAFLEPLERDLVLNVNFARDNKAAIAAAVERQHVLNVCQNLEIQSDVDELRRNHEEKKHSGPTYDNLYELEEKREENTPFRNYICGVIPIDQQILFNRMLYRISRGNAFARFVDIEGEIADPSTGDKVRKAVFYVVLLGRQLNTRITKMCDLFRATIYPLPESRDEYERELRAIRQEIKDKTAVNKETTATIERLLNRLASDGQSSPLRDWQAAINKEKTICGVLMKAHFYLTMIALEGWVPATDVRELKTRVKRAVAGTGNPPAAVEVEPTNPIKPKGIIPTYFQLNKFTETYQGIVDTYGVPRYQEVNPGLFTIITFPFLFGVMYGDVGHGVLLTLAALFLILNEQALLEKQRKGTLGEIPSMAFGGRYVIILMGCFAIYMGTIYNDCLSIPFDIYGSTYHFPVQGLLNSTGGLQRGILSNVTPPMTEATLQWDGTVYPYGVDPSWQHKVNSLAFYNSMKMKMAVTLGVIQMTFGIFLSLLNHMYFKDYLSIWFEFVPRLIFMMSTFGYMIFMIWYKWCVDWSYDGANPPNLIQTMIAMFLSPGSVESDKQLYKGQGTVQAILLLAAVFSVPVMLFAKPCIKKSKYKKEQLLLSRNHVDSEAYESAPPSARHSTTGLVATLHAGVGKDEQKYQDEDEDEKKGDRSISPDIHVPSGGDGGHSGGGHGHDGPFSFSDEMIHNAIHTIEFVLGTVSNTASYLRLWALSLAHAELAAVFWDKMMAQYGYEGGSPIVTFGGFAVWFAATFAVLLCMDTLECFLHALRLHWVEFQNKFYYADGIAFEPYNFIKPVETQ